jgi:hypothetical protein
MWWVRANLRIAGWCGLFALALQLILSFGHFHHNGTWSASYRSSLASSDGAISDALDTNGGPSVPGAPGADYCGICAVVHLAGSLVSPTTPAVVQPVLVGGILAWRIAETSVTPPSLPHARARAPPAV